MFKQHNQFILASVLCTLISSTTDAADANQATFSHPNRLATITPATVNPPTINPATITPSTITPPVITPPTITPQTITPSTTTPSNTTPAITTPTTITPTQVSPGNTSEATSTSIRDINAQPTATDVIPTPLKEDFPVGMVIKIHEPVEVLKKNRKVYTLKEQSLFFAHDIIFTKNNSSVALRFNDGTLVVVGPDSALEIKEFHFTIPPKGQGYQGNPDDRAQLKLYKGFLKARLGSLAVANKSNDFSILTPRGRIQLSDAKKNANIDLIYNNKVGLIVKVVGVLNNSKGQVAMDGKPYGAVSAVIGSAPTTTALRPLALSEPAITSSVAFFNSVVSQINNLYSESAINQEIELLKKASPLTENSNNDTPHLDDTSGDDDGNVDNEDSDGLEDDNQ